MKKAIFFDIDGTLIDCFDGLTQMTPGVEASIRKLQEQGHYVFIATGRPYAFIPQYLRDFGFDGFVLANGAQAMMADEDLFACPMESEVIDKFVKHFEEHSVQYILEGKREAYMKECFEAFYEFYDYVGVDRIYIKSEYALGELELFKIELLCPTPEIKKKCMAFVDEHPEYGYFQSVDERSLEIYYKENTKAAGILKVLEHLNIPVENSYAFGDGTNDIEMLSTVGCGIAMGNASDVVKSHAKYVTDTVHNDGVAIGIEKYLL